MILKYFVLITDGQPFNPTYAQRQAQRFKLNEQETYNNSHIFAVGNTEDLQLIASDKYQPNGELDGLLLWQGEDYSTPSTKTNDISRRLCELVNSCTCPNGRPKFIGPDANCSPNRQNCAECDDGYREMGWLEDDGKFRTRCY